ncbi:MAG: translocation/assembly module TamB domain-containing protein [Acidobacteria bacterium]|nr:translocation/assembly module TamB domain-containing protein [Acidobacteriota bacterium]
MSGLTINPDQPPPTPPRRRWWRWVVRAVVAVALLVAGGVLFLQSAAFQQMVRTRLIAALEQSTGTRVELREFSVNWSRLEVLLRGLILHGLEGEEAEPLFSADWIEARWKLLSFWSLSADLEQIRVVEPRVNILIGEDGRSNLPPLPRAANSDGRWAQQLLALKIGRLQVQRGELRWNQRRVPLDFRSEQLQLRLDYEAAQDRYSGRFDFRDAVLSAVSAAPITSQGQVLFHLYADHAEIASFDWRSAQSRLTLDGVVRDFRSPRFDFRFDSLVDQSEATPLLRSHGWIGDVAWKGAGSFAADGWEIQGDLLARTQRNGIPKWTDIPWIARGKMRVAPAASETSDKAGPSSWQATLTSLQVDTLGGQLVGSATVRNTARGPETTLDFEAQRLSFPAMTQAMSALPVRLVSLQWAGAVSGPLHAHFVGMGKEFTVEADWEVAASADVPPGFTPISGKLTGQYDAVRKRVESRDSYIDLPRTRLSGSGWFAERESQMRLNMNTSNLPENRTLFQLVWKQFTELPLRLEGSAAAQVDWTGGTARPRMAGDFRVEEFAYQDTRWDHFSGRLDYQRGITAAQTAAEGETLAAAEPASLAIRSGKLSRGDAGIDFDLQLGLGSGGFRDDSPFSVQARVRNARAEEFQHLIGRSYPITGMVQASFTASGTRKNPIGSGTLTVSNGALYEESFDRLSAELRLDSGGMWTADPMLLQKAGGTVQGKVSFHPGQQQFRFDLTGSEIALASIRALQRDRLRLAGTAEGRLSGGGSLDRPQIRGEIRIRQFGLGVAESGSVAITVESRDGRAFWSATGDLWKGRVSAKGETVLDNPYPITADVNFEDLDLPLLVRAFREPPSDLEGKVKGTLRAQGNAKEWSGMTLSGELSSLEMSVRRVSLHSIGPVPFQYEDDLIRLPQLRLQGPRAEIETSGTVRVTADPALSLNAKGQMDLEAFRQIDSEFAPAGRVQLDAQIGGTAQHPLWRGRLLLSEGSLRNGNLPNGLDHINGSVVFEGSRGVLENVTAESGGGRLQLSGYVRYGGETGWQFNLSGNATAVRVRYPEGLSTWADVLLTWAGTLQNSSLEGRAVLTRQSVSPQFDLVQTLLSRKSPTDSAAMPEVLRNMRLNLEVTSAADLRLDTLTTRNLQTDVELRIQGTVAQPAWLGRIGILGGEILFAGKRYTVNRGEISFVNPFRFEPLLSLSVQARVQRYDIAMDFSGPPDRLTVTYRSDPPLPTRDILALLVAGRARDTSLETSTNQPLPELGADALLSQALQSQIGSRLDRLFGSGRVRVDPQISGLGRSANASIALEQQISDDISVLYVTDVTSTQQQTIQAEWNLSPKLSVVAIRDQNGLIGVNFQITLRYR